MACMSEAEALECKLRAGAVTWTLNTYYQQPGTSTNSLEDTLDALVTLTERGKRLLKTAKNAMQNSLGRA